MNHGTRILAGLLCVAAILFVAPHARGQTTTNVAELERLARVFEQELEARRTPLYRALLETDEEPQRSLNRSPEIELMYIDVRGMPVLYGVDNLDAARTVGTDEVWPGGGQGFSLTGSGTAAGALGIWDAGGVRATHQELTGRVTQVDNPSGLHYHATHVAGTMIAGGVDAQAIGMSYQANLSAYDWTSDKTEMATAAANGMNVSNHSYGFVAGWRWDSQNGYWVWYGDLSVDQNEDYTFGFYPATARDWDQVAYNAPFYTIVKSAGNDRGDGPGGAVYHWHWDNQQGNWVWDNDLHEDDGGADGFDCIPSTGNAKNIITVGAAHDIPGGYSQPSDVQITSFSGIGPADDGRLKPDLVANGYQLRSCLDNNDSAYGSLSGTSMSSPNLSGSLNLLVRHYEATHSSATPRSATMKAVLIQTANEAGSATGPDYTHGWGLMNTLGAAQLISADGSNPGRIVEATLADGATDVYYLDNPASGDIRLTIAWTDPAGTPVPPALNPTTPMLVNDLDLRLEAVATGTVYRPWILDPSNPANAAATGDNARDNVEQVFFASAPAGRYKVTVTHKGSLGAPQAYSIASTHRFGGGLDIADHDVGNLVLSMTDQGILGFLDATQTDGSGFVYPSGGSNHLYVGGLWVAQCADYVANRDYDAEPEKEWVVSTNPDGHVQVIPNGASDQDILAGYTDDGGQDPYGFYVRQESWAFSDGQNDDFVIARYFVHNASDSTLDEVRVGLFLDFDLGDDPADDVGAVDRGRHAAYMTDGSGIHVGARLLRGGQTSNPIANETLIRNRDYVWPNEYILDEDKLDFLAGSDSAHVLHASPEPDDYGILLSAGPFVLAPGDSNEVVFAIIGASSLAGFLDHADQAQARYLPTTRAPAGGPLAERGPRLLPNLPNPFNPRTLVRFEIPRRSAIRLDLFDARGRHVRSLADGPHEAGRHQIVWDGRDDRGRTASGGVYFLRLTDGRADAGRRIIMLK
ncbi:MAG: S8 family serine peptidase [Candidatus Eisenbacteria bacterium]|nr:S8 family serine peptidase [Candidatus Latescibacterota bacterium]MBD3301503.1 S8 family serine peptidase [Candidatus Eisenbacteria bacterium]